MVGPHNEGKETWEHRRRKDRAKTKKNAFIGLDNEFGLRQVEEEPKQVANGDAYL